MKFTIYVSADTKDRNVKNECLEALAQYFNKKRISFDVRYSTKELDVDNIGSA